jgi:hypothetical protein
MSTILLSRIRRVFGTGIVALGVAGAAGAQVYSFNTFLRGGGGGQDPQKQRIARQSGAFVCLGVSPGTERNTIRLMIASRIPQPNSRIGAIAIDMGRHAGLFRSVAVAMASPGVKGIVVPPQPHPFLHGMTPEFWIDVPQRGHLKPDGLGPGKLIAITATLGEGKTVTDVLNALNEGLNPTSGVNGLRVGVIILYLLGGPPPGVATIMDDGGFVTTRASTACQ